MPSGLALNQELLLVLGLLCCAVVMFARNKPRMDVVALLMMVALPLTGVISPTEALMGLSDPNIVLIAALFVIGEGLVRTGVAQQLGDWLTRRAGASETRLLVLLMMIVAGVGAFMSSTGVVAIFIPIVLRIARQADIPAARLMMPLSVAALISGMMTLVATAPNLVIQAELVRRGHDGFGFFSFTPFGVPILVLALVYMVVVRRFLGRDDAGVVSARPLWSDWVRQYGLAGRDRRLLVTPESLLPGETLESLNLRGSMGINILAIERPRRFGYDLIEARGRTRLKAGDVLLIDIRNPDFDMDAFCQAHRIQDMPLSGVYFRDRFQEMGMAEVLVSPNARMIGKTLLDLRFRSVFDVTVVGLRHGKQPVSGSVVEESLQAGDTLLVVGTWRAIRRLAQNRRDLIVLDLPAESDDVAPARRNGPFALFTLLLVIAMMVTGVVSNVQAALIGCLLLGWFKCIDMPAAYRSIHWQSLVLIVGMLPFSLALQRTGGIDLAAQGLLAALDGVGPQGVLAAVFATTAVLGLFISNTATAVLMTPVALAIAQVLNASPYPFAMTVALASSAAFMTPVSSPVNTLVVGPGNYRFMDFVIFGVPLTVLVMGLTVFLVPRLLPF